MIWKDVIGYEGIYQVSNTGQVKRIAESNNQYKAGYVLKQQINRGYCSVELNGIGKPKCVRVHRLVAMAFIPNEHNKPHINHINGIRNDNRVENLQWVTPKENEIHKHRVLKSTVYKYKVSDEQVKQMIALHKSGKRMRQISEMVNLPIGIIHNHFKKHNHMVGLSGQYNGSAKIKAHQIEEIKNKRMAGATYKQIASEYGVSYQTISRIVQNQTFRETV